MRRKIKLLISTGLLIFEGVLLFALSGIGQLLYDNSSFPNTYAGNYQSFNIALLLVLALSIVLAGLSFVDAKS